MTNAPRLGGLLAAFLLVGCGPAAEEVVEEPLAEDAEDASIEADLKADVAGIRDWSPESRGVLWLASEEPAHYLVSQARLTQRVANAIHRAAHGADGFTPDRFTTLAELDRVPYTGTTVFQALLKFAKRDGRVLPAIGVTTVATARHPKLEAVRAKGKALVEAKTRFPKFHYRMARISITERDVMQHYAQQVLLSDFRRRGVRDIDVDTYRLEAASADKFLALLTGGARLTAAETALRKAFVDFLALHPEQITALAGKVQYVESGKTVSLNVVLLGQLYDDEWLALGTGG